MPLGLLVEYLKLGLDSSRFIAKVRGMPCYSIKIKCSSMPSTYEGNVIKTAHTEKLALDFLGSVLDKRKPSIRIDKKTRNIITILSIETI